MNSLIRHVNWSITTISPPRPSEELSIVFTQQTEEVELRHILVETSLKKFIKYEHSGPATPNR